MTATPTFPRFAVAPKCDPAQLLPPELLLDRPVRRWAMPEFTSDALLWTFILTVAVYAGWQSYQSRTLGAQVGELLAAHARQTELAMIVGSEEAQRLMAADRVRAAGMPEIEGVE